MVRDTTSVSVMKYDVRSEPMHSYKIIKTFNHYSVSQKNPHEDLWQFFQNDWEFFKQILYTYYAFISPLDYEFIFNYLQL